MSQIKEDQDINFKLEFQIMQKKIEILEVKQDQMRMEKLELQKQNEKYSQELEIQQIIVSQMKQQIDSLQAQLQERYSKSCENLSSASKEIQDMLSNIKNDQFIKDFNSSNLQDKQDEQIVRTRSSVQFQSVQEIQQSAKTGSTQEDQSMQNESQTKKSSFQVLQEGQRKSFYKPLDRDLKRRMEEIHSTSDSFFFDNGISFDIADSPFYKVNVCRVEKRAENMKSFLKKFAKNLKDLVKNGEIYSQTLKALSKEVSLNLNLVEDNKELFSMFTYTSEYFKDLTNFYDALNFNLTNLVISPLKNYTNVVPDQLKDVKKKFQKLQEDFEAIELKNSQQKKATLQKDKNHYSNTSKNHLLVAKQYEQIRYEYTCNLNKLQYEMNTEISNSICALLQAFATFNEQQQLEMRQLDSYLRLFKTPQNLKNEYYEEMQHRLNQLKVKVENPNQTVTQQESKQKQKVKGEYLHYKSHKSKEFKRKYFLLEKGKFYAIKIKKGIIHREQLSALELINFNEFSDCDYANSFEVISPQMKKPLVLIAPSNQSLQEWKLAFQMGTESYLSKGPIMRDREESNQDELIYQIIQNNICADCSKPDPSWISLNLCVVICLECSGIHRKLGPNISKVRSLKLDNIPDDILEFYLFNGTQQLNEMWEKNASKDLKPTFESTSEQKENWIKAKYVDQKFIEKDLSSNLIDLMCKAIISKKPIDIINIVFSRSILLDKLYQIQSMQQTFLHYACINSNSKVVSLLIQMGADINSLNQEKKRPLDIAKQAGNSEIYQFLLSKE
ncbi:hypothetical protein ABPG73_007974 [Tetrahymena malaccensis]